MSETRVDLESQRLLVSTHLGNEFQAALEGIGEIPEEISKTIELVRKHLSENPNTKLIGYNIEEKNAFSDFEASLCQQMGLPPGFKMSSVRDRLAGREKDFLLVVLGIDNLSPKDQKRVQKEAKRLGVKSILA